MKKAGAIIEKVILMIVLGCLVYCSIYFYRFNEPIIKNDWLMITISSVLLVSIGITAFWKRTCEKLVTRIVNIVLSLAVSSFIVYSVLYSVLLDYFQPLSLYDQIIYVALVGLVIAILYFMVQSIAALINKKVNVRSVVIVCLIALFIGQFYGLNLLQKDFEYTNIQGEKIDIFQQNEGGYATFRIPSILVINKGETLNNGQVLENDIVIVMAEARRNGSLDDGDIDLVQKISIDGGVTWSDLMVIQTFEDGIGKVGNSTPVFDSETGRIMLPHIAGAQKKDYKTYLIASDDGGMTWSEPELIFEGIVGPGHGIMIENGEHVGRLVVPAYFKGGSMCIYSDDNGVTWQQSEKLSDGNEAEIVEIGDEGELLMIVRTNIGVATPHDELQKIYVTSNDGGATWSDIKSFSDIKEPICMSSIVRSGDSLYYSHPDDYYSRGQMTIALSTDMGNSFTQRRIIYQGASGYSDLGVTHDGDLLLAFENGSIEYDERITLVKSDNFN